MKMLDLNNIPQTDSDAYQYIPTEAIMFYDYLRENGNTILQSLQETYDGIANKAHADVPTQPAKKEESQVHVDQFVENRDAFDTGRAIPSPITYENFCHMILLSDDYLTSEASSTPMANMRYTMSVYMGYQSKGGILIEDGEPEDDDDSDMKAYELVQALKQMFESHGASVHIMDDPHGKEPRSLADLVEHLKGKPA